MSRKLYKIKPKNSLTFLNIPGSKSLSIRSLLFAALANGTSTIQNILSSDDIDSTIKALEKLGVIISIDNCIAIVTSKGAENFNKKAEIYLGSSGILARFLPSILASIKNAEYILTTSKQLKNRPIKPLFDILEKFGVNIQYLEKNGHYPVRIITGNNLSYIDTIEISGKESSQFVSSAIILASLIRRRVCIKVEDIKINHKYILMLLNSMRVFSNDNFSFDFEKNSIIIFGNYYTPTNITIEPDLNTAMYFLSIAYIANMDLTIKNINFETKQPGLDFINILKKMGANIYTENNSITVKKKNIYEKPIGNFEIDMFTMAEMVPTLACLAVFANKPITIKNVEHIRNHETDRITTITEEFNKINVIVDEFKDGLKIYPNEPFFKLSVNPHNDHRIAMSFAIFAVKYDIVIDNYDCVSKTCPNFFELLNNVGIVSINLR